jgi:prophage regulatory protein
MRVTTHEKSDSLPVLVAHHDAACEETNNIKAGSMMSTFLKYRNAINNIQLSDFVDKCSERTSHDEITIETTKALKRVMQDNQLPEAEHDVQSENSTTKVLKAEKPRAVDPKLVPEKTVSLNENHLRYSEKMPQHHAMLRLKQVIERTGLSRSTVYNKLDPRSKHHDPSFPKQIGMGSGSVRWLESELEAWINCKINLSRNERNSD